MTTTTLDAEGRTTEIATAGLLPVVISYDNQGRMVTTTQGARQWQYGYDADGLLSSSTDPLGRVTLLGYDGASRLTSETRPDASVLSQSYDPNGNTATVTPPTKPAHGFGYSPVDLLSAYTPPDVGIGPTATTRSYDIDRRPTLIARPDGKSISYGYDAAARLQTTTAPSGTRSRSYDPLTGQLSTISGPDGVVLSFGYDGHLLTQASWAGPVSGTVELDYNDDFRLALETVNAASPIAYGYDADGLLTSAGELTLTRDPQNGLLTATSLQTTAEALTYNGFGELSSYEAAVNNLVLPIMAVSYVRDALGRIIEKTETIESTAHTYGYDYDLAGRLSEVTVDSVVTATYTYDNNGNRLSEVTSNGTRTGSYDNQDRLLSYGPYSFTYTAAGELLTKTNTLTSATTTYSYDAFGNLRSVTLPTGELITYKVDGRDRRIEKRIDGVFAGAWLYRDQLRIVAELDELGNIAARFIYTNRPNVPDYMVKGGNTYRIFHDHLGSVRLVVDAATGTVAQRIDYDAWGNVLLDTNPGFQPFGFAGGLYDPDTGLVRFGARDYDAEVGRWTAKDPIGFDGGDSLLYGYVLGDPVNSFDPSGRLIPSKWWWPFGGSGTTIRLPRPLTPALGPAAAAAAAAALAILLCEALTENKKEWCSHTGGPLWSDKQQAWLCKYTCKDGHTFTVPNQSPVCLTSELRQ